MTLRHAELGRYRLEEILGRGGMALVYRGYDEALDRPVAIKLLADNLMSDESSRRRFLHEARMAARLADPNIVRVYDSGELEGRPYIVMEYVDGETLAELLDRRGKLASGEAIKIALQVCAGLQHAHEAGLVHRDVKPQNLLLRSDSTVKIADFGIARSAHGTKLTEIGSILGTAAYLAPEQAVGQDVTAAADIYALGVVLYEMLTGRTPYTFETLTQLLVGEQDQPVTSVRELAPDVSPGLEEVIMRCLARMPVYRPASAAALADELVGTGPESATRPLRARGAGSEQAPSRFGSARTPAPVAKLSEAARRSWSVHRPWIWAAAVAVVALLALGVGLASVGDPDTGSAPPAPAAEPPAEQAREFSAWLRAHSE